MITQNLHTHTSFDDGGNTAEEMVLAAIAAGLTSLGFSGHSPMELDMSSIPERVIPCYRAEIARLRESYRDRLEIFCGLEWDCYSKTSLEGYDYVIGSVHFLHQGDDYRGVDHEPEITAGLLQDWYGGDAIRAAQDYYAQYELVAGNPRVDIVGHLDVLTKFDERDHYFDWAHPLYREAALAALERLARADKIVEINTGAIYRGYRTTPYPDAFLLRRLRELDGRIVITSDSHSADSVACHFAEAAELAQSCGFREIWRLTGDGFQPEPL